MGVAASSNQVLKGVTLLVLVVAGIVVVRSCTRESPPRAIDLSLPDSLSPVDLGAEGDTETETLRTLIGEVRRLREDYAEVQAENASLSAQNTQLQRMEDRLADRLDTELQNTQSAIGQRTESVERQSRDIARVLESMEQQLNDLLRADRASTVVPGTDLPVGLGFDDYLNGSTDTVIWVDPLDAPDGRGANTDGPQVFPERLESLFNKVGGQSSSNADPLAPVPVLTVPRNSTLVGARGFTALVGRIPVRGQVVDPFPFKVLVGADNLAANGFQMPELFGMVFSGRAVGDWTLSCVRGEIFSVTYILEDGSIQSYPKGDTEVQENRPIGWISDPFGVPCVSGERKTNAQGFLAQRVGLSTAAAAADAAAAAQTATTVSGATGTATTAVTGDIGAFIRNRTIADGIDEVATWLDERQAQSFDAIYVPPDSELVVHVTQPLAIDHDPQGRKVNHHVDSQTQAERPLD